ncbi:MAG: VOC family protein [Prevotellaceae bacterium]|jgi:predicted enzyme related to lactoylglutathione lyase|nr:VOC family protein [Prevotellaceae bacterium]
MKKIFITTLAAFAFDQLEAQTIPAFLQGTWKMENENIYEHWDILSQKHMKGISYTTKNGNIVFIEYLNIAVIDKEVVYTATVPGHNQGQAIDFMQITDNSLWIFENLRHDFPQRIVYEKLSNTEISVQLSGGDKNMYYKMIKHSSEQKDTIQKTKKVTSIGGIFFKCKDPQKMKEWYRTYLGINTNEYGAVFEWHQGSDVSKKGFTQWTPFTEKTKYFEPSIKDFMINYRVENIETLVEELRKNGVSILDSIEAYEYGKFIHIVDIEGNKLELWEPDDIEYEKLGKQLGSETTK